MTRILRLLLIAAIALPLWQPMAAQERVANGDKFPLLINKSDQKGSKVVTKAKKQNVSYAPSLKAGKPIYDYYDELAYDGNNSSQNVPIRCSALNTNRSEGQMIYSKDGLPLQPGDIITSITFFKTDTTAFVGNATNTVTLRIGETTATSIPDSRQTVLSNRASLTPVYTGPLTFLKGYIFVEFEFDQPYTYQGDNLMLDLERISGDYAATVNWYYGNGTSNCSYYSYGSNNSGRNSYLPSIRIGYKRLHQGTVSDRTIVVKDSTFFAGKEYTWTDNEGTHTSNLNDVATVPEQMIAMARKIYTDPTIPGNLKRGFASDGSNTGETNQQVYYAGVGGIKYTGSVSHSAVLNVNNYSYDDIYGWGIPGNPVSVGEYELGTDGYLGGTTHERASYTYLNINQYKPNEEGLTLLLVELKEDYVDGSNNAITNSTSYSNGYERLKAYFENTVKSIRVINQAKHMGEGFDAGTLFKIDCDKMNKFFLLAKGQLHLDHSSILGFGDDDLDFCVPPGYFNVYTYDVGWISGEHANSFNRTANAFIDPSEELFYQMFEQFSPSMPSDSEGAGDLYQKLINMESFPVRHDCLSITGMNHQFLMYGADSEDKDCQDVRDMMFFVPDYRMLNHNTRSYPSEEYLNYHPDMQPTVGLYVIRQNEITPTTEADDYYMLNLNWVTNLDDFLPGEDQEFELLQVVVNDSTGLEEYKPVYYMNAQGQYTDENGTVVTTPVPIKLHLGPGAEKNYPSVYVKRETYSQQVTYAIRGRDKGHFLSLQISNRQSYIIPGTDPTELVSLVELAHYSRYNPDNEENCYSNRFKLSNNVGGVRRADITSAQNNQTVFTFTRKTSTTDENPVVIATARVTEKTSGNSGVITVKMENQADKTEFPKAKVGDGYAGYHANPDNGEWEHTFTYNTVNNVQYVNFGDLVLCDNFIADVSANEHPNQYIYEVHFNIATSNTGSHEFTEAHGSAFHVPIYKTASKVNNAYSLIEVKGDMDHAIKVEDFTFSERVQYSSKTEILRYDVYRWPADTTRYIVNTVGANDAEQDLAPDGIAGNQGEGYTVTMNDVNGDYYYNGGEIAVSSGTAWADFVDYYPQRIAAANADSCKAYVYAPVVETFTVGKNVIGQARTDYNTYGGPQQRTAVGVIDINDPHYEISTYSWLKDGERYAYYTVDLPIKTDEVPAGYKIYMVRAWRVVDPDLLDEPLEAFAKRKTATGEYMFEEMLGPNEEGETSFIPSGDGEYQPGMHMSLGAATIPGAVDESGHNIPVYRGTFGARKVITNTQGVQDQNDYCLEGDLPMTFRVRMYFTKENTSKAGEQDKTFYVAEYTTDFSIKGGIPTGIVDVMSAKKVVSEKYYNVAGIESDTPFQGVNIVVTRYSDGSTTTTKILK
ncbi:MAG: hypothetical protein II462_02840 [Muribaculaceae bacterium]|nr:hypothetical protein [Muribaculaceae bacterium]